MKISEEQMKELTNIDITIIGIITANTVRAYRSYVDLSDGAIVCIDWLCIMNKTGATLEVSSYSCFPDIGKFATDSTPIDFAVRNNLIGGELAQYVSNLDWSTDRRYYTSAHITGFKVDFSKVKFVRIW